MCPALVCDKPVHVWCVWIHGKSAFRESRSNTIEMYGLEKHYNHASLMKLGSQKERRDVNSASAEGKAIKHHPFLMSKDLHGKKLLEASLCEGCCSQNLLLVRCLCKITSLVGLWDQTWVSPSARNMVSGCCLAALGLKSWKKSILLFFFFLFALHFQSVSLI